MHGWCEREGGAARVGGEGEVRTRASSSAARAREACGEEMDFDFGSMWRGRSVKVSSSAMLAVGAWVCCVSFHLRPSAMKDGCLRRRVLG